MSNSKLHEMLGEWYNTELYGEFKKSYLQQLQATIRVERATHKIYPPREQVTRALQLCSPENTKIVVVGQCPFHGYNQANGIAFSVNEDPYKKIPPSLSNIFKELEDDIGFQPDHNSDLSRWARQGILLLNAVLTVREGQPGSHVGIGWQEFTGKILEIVCKKETPVVFLLWGKVSQQLAHIIPNTHYCLFSAHPSPYSANRGFFDTKPFSRANEILTKTGQSPIDWLNNDM